ncbi:MAG: hypothetical protein ACLQME_19950 [Alphaproteobacteria bacterium]
MSEPPTQNSQATGDEDHTPAEEQNRMAHSFDTYARRREASDAKQAKHNRKIRRWTRAATIGALIYTAVTGAILLYGIRSFNLNSETARHQLRAYVFLKSGEIDLTGPTTYKSVPIFKNWGQTPAYRVRAWTNSEIREFPLQSELHIRQFGQEQVELGPGAEMWLDHKSEVPLQPTDLGDIRAGRKAFYVWGTIRYIDEFGCPRFINFRLASREEERPGVWSLHTEPAGNNSDQQKCSN